MYEPSSVPVISRREFTWRLIRHFAVILSLVLLSLSIGMLGYTSLARMSAVDAFLNSAMLLGGMGPVGDLPTTGAKVFAGTYALYAGIVFIFSTGIIIAPFAHRILHKLHADEGDDDAHAKSPRRTKSRSKT
jgi:hypothetical protein